MFKKVFLLFIIFNINHSFAVSFDCKKASSYVEKSICNDAELSAIDSRLNEYYQYLITDMKQYPEDKGHDVFVQFQKSWLKYRNQCESQECIFDLYAKQISDLYTNHYTNTGDYSFFTKYNKDAWFNIVLKSYGIKSGISFNKLKEILANHGWQLQMTEDGISSKNGVFCGSGYQAVCHAFFIKGTNFYEPILIPSFKSDWYLN